MLDIPGTRPAFFTQGGFIVMDDLRAFRHVFRNLYGRPLDAEKLMALQIKLDPAIEGGDLFKLGSVAEASSFKVDLVDIMGSDEGFARLVRERERSLRAARHDFRARSRVDHPREGRTCAFP
jgi:hypothetical protein